MSQRDNGVSRPKFSVYTYSKCLLQYLSSGLVLCVCSSVRTRAGHEFFCLCVNRVSAVCHLSVQHRNVSELYFDQQFSDALAYSQIKSWRVIGFEAAVLATTQWQGAKLLSGHGTMPGRAICLSIKKEKKRYVWPDYLSNFYSQNTSCSQRCQSWPTVLSVSPGCSFS